MGSAIQMDKKKEDEFRSNLLENPFGMKLISSFGKKCETISLLSGQVSSLESKTRSMESINEKNVKLENKLKL
jgi:hypothetical protein